MSTDSETRAFRIRRSMDADLAAISGVHMNAFGESEGPVSAELVAGLLEDPTARPLLSLVAERDSDIIGHVLFTAVRLAPDHGDVPARILAPLAVSAKHQGRDVGGALIREGLDRLADDGVELVFVLGHPGYYPRFGFQPAGVLGFEAPYPIPAEHAEAWMVTALRPGVIGSATGLVRCAEVLDEPQYWQE